MKICNRCNLVIDQKDPDTFKNMCGSCVRYYYENQDEIAKDFINQLLEKIDKIKDKNCECSACRNKRFGEIDFHKVKVPDCLPTSL